MRRDSLFAYFHDGGFDNVLECLLGLVPHHEPFAARVRWHVRLAELDSFGLASLPMFKGHTPQLLGTLSIPLRRIH